MVVGDAAADYVGKMGVYMVKYGPQKPFDKLIDLGIHPFFFFLQPQGQGEEKKNRR